MVLTLPSILISVQCACAGELPWTHSRLGVGYSPAHMPFPSDKDVAAFFVEAAEVGGNFVMTCDWRSMPAPERLRAICAIAKANQLKLHLYLDPIALEGARRTPAIPKSAGGKSLADPEVRQAYESQVIELAALHPDYIGLATEVNLLARNHAEYSALLSLMHEARRRVKESYPSLPITASFQWDVMSKSGHPETLRDFSEILDVYSFTSYPDTFGNAAPEVPDDYFLGIRRALPVARIGISELGWSSATPGTQKTQADFMRRIPAITKGLGAEYVVLAELHDVPIFSGDQQRLNAVGLRTVDDVPKESWDVVVHLPALQ